MLLNASAWKLTNQRVLVTGASRGIGLAIARVLAGLGADLMLVARDATRLQAVRDQLLLERSTLDVQTIALDVSSERARDDLIEVIGGAAIDILVNNAGTNIRKATVEYSAQEYWRVMHTNLTACFELTRRLHSNLKRTGGGCVVNVASVAGLTALRTGSPYAMSKAAMLQLTKNLACEWAADGIRVNAVAPWYIRTPLAEQVLQDPEYRDAVLARTPMGRIGEADEVANVVAFLCLPASSYVSGECVAVDGGFTSYGF